MWRCGDRRRFEGKREGTDWSRRATAGASEELGLVIDCWLIDRVKSDREVLLLQLRLSASSSGGGSGRRAAGEDERPLARNG